MLLGAGDGGERGRGSGRKKGRGSGEGVGSGGMRERVTSEERGE